MVRKNQKQVVINSENTIKKSNELSMGKLSQGFNLNQMQLLAYAIFCTQNTEKTSFHKKDFEEKFGLERYKTAYIKEDMDFFDESLVNLIDIVNLEEEFIKKKSIKIFREIEYNKGLFTFEWDKELLPHIINLQQKYVLTDLTITAKFKSGFSWILYDFLRGLYGYWRKPISKESLMQLLGVEGKKTYQNNTGKFKQSVLDVAVAEINQFTELEVRYETEKEGRTIVGFDLIWSTGEKLKSATRKQIKELKALVDVVLNDSMSFMDLDNKTDRQSAMKIIEEAKRLSIHTTEPICITASKADLFIQQAKWNLNELHRLGNSKADLYYNWLEEE